MWKYNEIRYMQCKTHHVICKTQQLRRNVKGMGFAHHIHINRCTGGHAYAQKLEGEARLWYQQLIFKKAGVFFLSSSRERDREREKQRVETDLMRQRDHSLPSDLANILGRSSCLFCWSAQPRFLTMAACFHVSEARTQTKMHQHRLLLCRLFA